MMPALPSLCKLKAALEYKNLLLEMELCQEELETLEYACQAVNPSTHTECAFVVWACQICHPTQAIVDEYCRRRRGETPQMFDHQVLDLGLWWPNTYRILVFQEQWERLTFNLTQRTGIAFKIYQTSGSDEGYETYKHLILSNALDKDYEQRLSVEEINWLYKIVRKEGLPSDMISELIPNDLKQKLSAREITELSQLLPIEAISQEMFKKLIVDDTRQKISANEMDTLYKLIKNNYCFSESFASCSALVELALSFS